MGSFEARKTQCLEASHPRRPFWLDAQSHGAEGRVSPACDIDRPELSSGRVRRLKDLLPSGPTNATPTDQNHWSEVLISTRFFLPSMRMPEDEELIGRPLRKYRLFGKAGSPRMKIQPSSLDSIS